MSDPTLKQRFRAWHLGKNHSRLQKKIVFSEDIVVESAHLR